MATESTASLRGFSARFVQTIWLGAASLSLGGVVLDSGFSQESPTSGDFEFRQGERIVILGSTFADRLQHFGWLETRIQLAKPEREISLRNLGWSGDEVGLMPRPLDFGSLESHLADQRADTILLCFGTNESFKGEAGLPKFREDLVALIDSLQAHQFNGESAPRLVLVSPIAHEQLGGDWPDATPRNAALARYTVAMSEVAESKDLSFVDLFHPTRSLMAENHGAKLTTNGIHPTEDGYRVISEVLALGLGISDPLPKQEERLTALRDLIVEKNRQFMLRWRPVNAEYVFGRRKEPFGVLSFPPEMEQLDRQITALDEQIRAEAGKLFTAKP